jgi:hypothetical protein
MIVKVSVEVSLHHKPRRMIVNFRKDNEGGVMQADDVVKWN